MKFTSRITKKKYFVLLKGASILTLMPSQLHIQSVLWAVSRYQSGRHVSLMTQPKLVCKLTMSDAVILSLYMTSQRVHEHIYAYLYPSFHFAEPYLARQALDGTAGSGLGPSLRMSKERAQGTHYVGSEQPLGEPLLFHRWAAKRLSITDY